ncbi:MAG: DUF3422 family protein, partial [Burkholderiaceae bacterium]
MNRLHLPEHPLRERLNDELHARPPMALGDGEWISYLALLHDANGWLWRSQLR